MRIKSLSLKMALFMQLEAIGSYLNNQSFTEKCFMHRCTTAITERFVFIPFGNDSEQSLRWLIAGILYEYSVFMYYWHIFSDLNGGMPLSR